METPALGTRRFPRGVRGPPKNDRRNAKGGPAAPQAARLTTLHPRSKARATPARRDFSPYRSVDSTSKKIADSSLISPGFTMRKTISLGALLWLATTPTLVFAASDARARRPPIEDTYTITSTLQILKPVDPADMADDFQDVRVLEQDESSVTVEITY